MHFCCVKGANSVWRAWNERRKTEHSAFEGRVLTATVFRVWKFQFRGICFARTSIKGSLLETRSTWVPNHQSLRTGLVSRHISHNTAKEPQRELFYSMIIPLNVAFLVICHCYVKYGTQWSFYFRKPVFQNDVIEFCSAACNGLKKIRISLSNPKHATIAADLRACLRWKWWEEFPAGYLQRESDSFAQVRIIKGTLKTSAPGKRWWYFRWLREEVKHLSLTPLKKEVIDSLQGNM